MKRMKTNSQYTAAITGCAYLFGEFLRVLPLMMADNREALLNYWLFDSKKGAFQCIAYLHSMDPYTPEHIRTKYLLPHQAPCQPPLRDDRQEPLDLDDAIPANYAKLGDIVAKLK